MAVHDRRLAQWRPGLHDGLVAVFIVDRKHWPMPALAVGLFLAGEVQMIAANQDCSAERVQQLPKNGFHADIIHDRQTDRSSLDVIERRVGVLEGYIVIKNRHAQLVCQRLHDAFEWAIIRLVYVSNLRELRDEFRRCPRPCFKVEANRPLLRANTRHHGEGHRPRREPSPHLTAHISAAALRFASDTGKTGGSGFRWRSLMFSSSRRAARTTIRRGSEECECDRRRFRTGP